MMPSIPELKSDVDGIVGFHLWQADIRVGSGEGHSVMDCLFYVSLSKLGTHLQQNQNSLKPQRSVIAQMVERALGKTFSTRPELKSWIWRVFL